MNESQITGLALLRAPFPDNQIGLLPRATRKDAVKGKCPDCGGWHALPAIHLSYVGHAAITDRLLDADPAWTWEPLSFTSDGLPAFDTLGGLWIKLTVCGVTRIGYGQTDKQGGDAIKEVIGDALRNASMRFGAALQLWHKGELHASKGEDEDSGHPPPPPPPPAKKEMPATQIADWLSAISAASDDELPGIVKAAQDAAQLLEDRMAWVSFRDAGKSRKSK